MVKPCITFTMPDKTTVKLYVLNPGQVFPNFGGSKTGMLVKRTPSLFLRTTSPSFGTSDVEYNVNDPDVWAAVARWTNDPAITATTD